MADAQAEGNPEIASGGDEGVVMIRWGGYRCPPSPAVPVAALEVRRGLAWWGWKWSGWLLERPWATPEPQGWGVIADHRKRKSIRINDTLRAPSQKGRARADEQNSETGEMDEQLCRAGEAQDPQNSQPPPVKDKEDRQMEGSGF